MIIDYCRSENLNFGDDLNLWLWPRLLGEAFFRDDGVIFMGIGTLLNRKRCRNHDSAEKVVVFGAGSSSDDVPILDERWHVYGVRGPRTARKLGLSVDKSSGDPAYLLSALDLGLEEVEKGPHVGFVPHHRSEDFVDWGPVCEAAGLRLISARQPVESFIREVRTCSKLVTEAMHGAIVADAFRVPWVPVSFAPNFTHEKWLDFFESMSLGDVAFQQLPFLLGRAQAPGRMIENGVKYSIAKLLGQPARWSRLPFRFTRPKAGGFRLLAAALTSVGEGPALLSADSVLDAIVEKQLILLATLKKDYASYGAPLDPEQASEFREALEL